MIMRCSASPVRQSKSHPGLLLAAGLIFTDQNKRRPIVRMAVAPLLNHLQPGLAQRRRLAHPCKSFAFALRTVNKYNFSFA